MSAQPQYAPRPLFIPFHCSATLRAMFGKDGRGLLRMGVPCRYQMTRGGRRQRGFLVADVEKFFSTWRMENEL